MPNSRWYGASRVALWHLGGVLLLLLVVAALVWGLWYPYPFDQLAHAHQLFGLLVLGVLVSGPLLTLLLYRPAKPRNQWRVDMVLIALLQLVVLGFGLYQLAQSRPMVIAFEGDRFRLVQAGSISLGQLDQAPPELAQLGYGGPRWLGVQLLTNTDPQYAKSVQLAMLGLHPALRPERWRSYASQQTQVQQTLSPLDALRALHPGAGSQIDQAIASTRQPEAGLGFVPLMHGNDSAWVVLVRRSDAAPLGFVSLSGWPQK